MESRELPTLECVYHRGLDTQIAAPTSRRISRLFLSTMKPLQGINRTLAPIPFASTTNSPLQNTNNANIAILNTLGVGIGIRAFVSLSRMGLCYFFCKPCLTATDYKVETNFRTGAKTYYLFLHPVGVRRGTTIVAWIFTSEQKCRRAYIKHRDLALSCSRWAEKDY